MDTSNPNDPLAGTGITYEAPATPAQQPVSTGQPTASTQVTSQADPLSGTGIQYEKPLSSTYKQVMDSDASKNANVQKLATQSGLTPQAVSKDPQTVEKAVSAP